MDFTHEAANAIRVKSQFKDLITTLYIPKIINAHKRVLIMEFIEGARPDNLEYLAAHNIDRNKVSLELAKIFGQVCLFLSVKRLTDFPLDDSLKWILPCRPPSRSVKTKQNPQVSLMLCSRKSPDPSFFSLIKITV